MELSAKDIDGLPLTILQQMYFKTWSCNTKYFEKQGVFLAQSLHELRASIFQTLGCFLLHYTLTIDTQHYEN
jgi:hypothetical protein